MPLVAGIAQLVEQWTENPRVGGSSPPPGIVGYCRLVCGSLPEWLMGADCKSAGYAYVGSNPTRPTTSLHSSAVEHSLGKGEVTSSILVEGLFGLSR